MAGVRADPVSLDSECNEGRSCFSWGMKNLFQLRML